ncbi:hypothetical protein [Thalassobellus suaedae]|uniref:Uncharacterized protein n=1 Tax=Thalassobellus suaedae TaxID=3074124 RepID=A0ABY9Y375_9FLAO|nr:hypothetical protein RHP49_16910 [Flavobacteriaceae bacterium HL-DH10]
MMKEKLLKIEKQLGSCDIQKYLKQIDVTISRINEGVLTIIPN